PPRDPRAARGVARRLGVGARASVRDLPARRLAPPAGAPGSGPAVAHPRRPRPPLSPRGARAAAGRRLDRPLSEVLGEAARSARPLSRGNATQGGEVMAQTQTPQPTAETPVRVSRTFEATRQRVYRAWTDPELLIRWFADEDTDMRVRAL